jgi:dienelactone hydrolase
VVGFDSKHYLSSFTEGAKTLKPEQVPGDYRALVDYARRGGEEAVLLVGVSEGAGLSVLAASDPALQPSLRGLLCFGLPDVNELGWRFSDSLIYLTHKTPKEPTFRAADYIPRLGPVPLAALHATHDEFVPLGEIQRLMGLPGGAKRLWVLEAADHRFSDKPAELRKAVLEALGWLESPAR